MVESCYRNGDYYILWIFNTFGSCIYGYQELISIIFGYLSVFCWLNAQFPQLIKNYRNNSVDGLSLSFLFIWFLGDITNLLGCVLTDQLPFQVYIATYFCIVDFCLFYQYFYYSWGRNPIRELLSLRHVPSNRQFRDSLELKRRKNSSDQGNNINSSTSTIFAIMFLTFHYTSFISYTSSISTPHFNLRSLDLSDDIEPSIPSKTFFQQHSLLIGRIFSWICTAFYLCSRIPQIIKNRKTKSVEGLSVFMFIFAALGNLTYSLSIFINPLFLKDSYYAGETIPYILGSIGTLGFDITIFIQWLRLRNNKSTNKSNYAMLSNEEEDVEEEMSVMNEMDIYKKSTESEEYQMMIEEGTLSEEEKDLLV
ncbi:hypothetical protein Glove_14g15 [Diversispora epigaea]|uniref:Uncharacterized protein n=1 Tax=Diversispora epigaea TaxID=1348612 RepID=A0A397JW15_9GLOM|nr:hypothetical protein Glove_14g15 [Diversispora epigaea]